ncbi:hypothetical protein [Paenibacillus sp. UNC496MF]|uniref:hypothetical protein n=1 Tax=Paenibacillus sp. UNC496MF TaxID=1502753 RepID=UPI000B823A78|nr:hypothetical protein [Paenibacillus sp. UNC496MF]
MLLSNRAVTANPIFKHAFSGFSKVKQAGQKARQMMSFHEPGGPMAHDEWEMDPKALVKFQAREEKRAARGMTTTEEWLMND